MLGWPTGQRASNKFENVLPTDRPATRKLRTRAQSPADRASEGRTASTSTTGRRRRKQMPARPAGLPR
eukprot:12506907-Alexandrium_andersonii.AAC.1